MIGETPNYWNNDYFNDTIFVFFGDNGTSKGCTTNDKDVVVSGFNGGMRGKKASAYEDSHRNLCLISTPGDKILGESRDVFGLTLQMDFLLTFIDLCGLSAQPENIDGVSLYPAFEKIESQSKNSFYLSKWELYRGLLWVYKKRPATVIFHVIKPFLLKEKRLIYFLKEVDFDE